MFNIVALNVRSSGKPKMSRGRKRKTEKGNFSEASMKRVVEEVVRHNVCLRVAASNNNVKFQTLFRYVKKLKADPNKSLEEVTMKPNYQSRLIFTSEQEKMLVDYILRCSKMCYGKSTIDVRKLAYEMAKINSIPIHPSWEDSKRASIDWMQAFIKRNPEVSIRQPENCSMSRATSFNKHNVDKFFNNLEEAYSRSELFADGSRVYNLDETGTTTGQQKK
ncbi:hypothetical protein PPYR_15343 [Photinus pyralis]|uniref:HTH CENPB-type domain-containing protein n=1 Tax=Photinus pyralis TaxID=7054 RepID=A0A5N3ZZ21_PHOPY|nr:hypothetical protein PPYR_15555 [Photinus pyralis]KAB0790314.1 hypothetical protein PPYR_15343 [Photinus pyralis]